MEKNHAVYSGKTKVVRFLLFLLLLIVALFTVYPVVYIVLGSF